jgi:hypothetical protein
VHQDGCSELLVRRESCWFVPAEAQLHPGAQRSPHVRVHAPSALMAVACRRLLASTELGMCGLHMHARGLAAAGGPWLLAGSTQQPALVCRASPPPRPGPRSTGAAAAPHWPSGGCGSHCMQQV